MTREQLYDKALEFQSLKLWEKLENDQVFAYEWQGQNCYVNIMGMLGEHRALAVYPGKDAVAGLWRMYRAQEESEMEMMAAGYGQNSLQCEFVSKEEMEEEELNFLQKYAKRHKLSLRKGKTLYPQFMKFRPFRNPQSIMEETDLEMLGAGLDAACWLAKEMGSKLKTLGHLFEEPKEIPLLRREGDQWKQETTPMPEELEVCYPIGHTMNDIYKARARKLKKGNIAWECRLIVYPKASRAEGMEELVIPWELLTLDVDTGKSIEVQRVRDYETRTEVMLDKLMEAMFRENVCPGKICVSDERTHSLLEDWAAEMKIDLSMEVDVSEKMEALEASALMQTDPERSIEAMEDMLDMMLVLPEEMVFSAPEAKGAIAQFEMMLRDPGLPENLRWRVSRLLEKADRYFEKPKKQSAGKKKKGKKKQGPEKSLVISVSLDTGCYRHIRISNHALLDDLSRAILAAFDFEDDHMHAFFMDNHSFSWKDAYYIEEAGEDGPATNEVTLEEVGVQVGQKFKYVFDFGDEWTFQCRVLKELDEKTAQPVVVRSKGEAPAQYPDWDEEEYWDDEEDDEDWEDDEEEGEDDD